MEWPIQASCNKAALGEHWAEFKAEFALQKVGDTLEYVQILYQNKQSCWKYTWHQC